MMFLLVALVILSVAMLIRSDEDAVRAHEILDRRALLQKFRVGGNIGSTLWEPAVRAGPTQDLRDPTPGADRYRRLQRSGRGVGGLQRRTADRGGQHAHGNVRYVEPRGGQPSAQGRLWRRRHQATPGSWHR